MRKRKAAGAPPAGVCGIDEAGRGAVVGPLVVAGVLVDREEKVRALGVKDSKALTPARREELDRRIREIAEVHVVVLDAAEVDARGRESLNSLEAFAFGGILAALRPRAAFLDAADVDEGRFGDDVRKAAGFDLEIVSEHKADSTYPVVSAASIIAKVRRDEEVGRIARAFARDSPSSPPLGSGYPCDPETVAFIRTWIKERGMLPPHARASWETSRRLLSEGKTRRLDEW